MLSHFFFLSLLIVRNWMLPIATWRQICYRLCCVPSLSVRKINCEPELQHWSLLGVQVFFFFNTFERNTKREVEKIFNLGVEKMTLKTILLPLKSFLVFRMYSQESQKWTPLSILEYHLGKVCGKNYLDDEPLLNKICELKNILG